MSTTERSWSAHFIWHIQQVPWQIRHMRDLTETTIAATDTSAVRVSGTSEQARLPYRVDPADDADLLYAALVIFARVVAQQIGGASPRALRERLWNGRDEPQGLPLCTPSEAFALAGEITVWLTTAADLIAHDPDLNDEPEELIALIRRMRARYPRAEPQFKAYRPARCHTCGERTILPIWGKNGLKALKCDTCGTRQTSPLEKAGIHTPKPPKESEDPAAPSATGNTKASPHTSTTPADASSKKNTSSPGGATE